MIFGNGPHVVQQPCAATTPHCSNPDIARHVRAATSPLEVSRPRLSMAGRNCQVRAIGAASNVRLFYHR
eukprot:13608626-Alexandrium_andersonii.AAC.1